KRASSAARSRSYAVVTDHAPAPMAGITIAITSRIKRKRIDIRPPLDRGSLPQKSACQINVIHAARTPSGTGPVCVSTACPRSPLTRYPSTDGRLNARARTRLIIRHLSYRIALAREGHFGRAAEPLHVSQPALSSAIRHLGDDFGVPLVMRSRQGFEGLSPE